MPINFSQELNPEQLDVVLNGNGPCLVLAGAGSGKTRVITYRVAKLLEQGVRSDRILLVTFTNKAADEMKQRIAALVQRDSSVVSQPNTKIIPWSGTFHHIAYRVLSMYGGLLGYKRITILDSDDSETLLKLCIKEAKPDTEERFPSPKVIGSIISYARNAEILLEEALQIKHPHYSMFLKNIQTIAERYEQRKREAQSFDFDDLLVKFLELLQRDEVRERLATQFEYILVDEYQDTNKLQASLIAKLSSVHRNVLVVGDDAQSIYSFRAADIENILRFEQVYRGARIFKLVTNYRSTKEILEVANQVIAHNVHQYKKELKSLDKTGPKPSIHPLLDARGEAQFVANEIEKALGKGVVPQEIAVLFRASHHAQMLEMELVRRGIAYDYRGGVRFFERAHIKDVLCYVRLLTNLADTAAWLRVLMHEEGVGPAAAQKIAEAMKNITTVSEVLEAGRKAVSGKALQGFEKFGRIWQDIITATDPHQVVEAVARSAYKEYLEAEYVDFSDRVQDIEQLAVFAERYEKTEDFLAEATLQESFVLSQGLKSEVRELKSQIVLSTIHQAKGLEWSTVFVIHLSNGDFPNERAFKEGGLEEERRLFYVAITRARERLYLSYPMARGGYGDMLATPSCFLDDIDRDLCEDFSLLNKSSTSFLDDGEIRYVSEDEEFSPSAKPLKIKPGSFLRSVEDL
jgi:DNA helicase-2/ATP-dependent DNA helicase PcrA